MSKSNQSSGKTINAILRFMIGIAAGVAFGLIIRQWMKENRQRGQRDLELTHQEVPLEVPQPRGPEAELSTVEEIDLSKTSPNYISAVSENLEDCEQAWGEPSFVRFVTTGKGIRPGYQVEAISGVNFQTFAGSNHVQRSPNRRLSTAQLTKKKYTKEDLWAAIE
jgi:hypothetical protein